jgi:hypothetical protein
MFAGLDTIFHESFFTYPQLMVQLAHSLEPS